MSKRSNLEVVSFDLRSAFGALSPELGGGFDRGFNTEGDVLTQTVDGRDLNEVWKEFMDSLQAWNTSRSALVNALTFPVQQPVEDVPQLVFDDFEEASEYGEPKGIRGGGYFSLGYDFKWYDLAARFTWKYLAEANASQVEAVHNMVLEADNRLVFQKVLKAIFNNVNRTASIHGNAFNVYPFYNNDGTTPPKYKNYTHASSHNHYLSSGGATVDSGDLDALELELKHHGYGHLTGTTLILLVNTQEINTIRTFRVSSGSSYDYIPAAGGAPWLLATNTGGVVTPQGSGIPSSVNGLAVAGRYGPWLIVEEDYVPAGYMVAFSSGGDNNANNPVGMREHQNPALRGLRIVKGMTADYPLIDSFYNRGFGTGVRQRGAGAVMKITAGAYSIPSDYA